MRWLNVFLTFYRKGKSASVPLASPSPWSSRFPAALPPSPTGPSSAASARTVAAAPLIEPPPCPWSSSALTARSWRSRWCSSRPAHATTTAPGRTTSLSPRITRRWSVTWRKTTTTTSSREPSWDCPLESNRYPSHISAHFVLLRFLSFDMFFVFVSKRILYMDSDLYMYINFFMVDVEGYFALKWGWQ